MDAKKFGVFFKYMYLLFLDNSYLTIPKNDYIVAEKNFCFHRENTLREERNNVRIYAGLSDRHRPDR